MQLAARLPRGTSSTVSLDLLATFAVDTFLAVLKWWMDNKMPYSPEHVEKVFAN